MLPASAMYSTERPLSNCKPVTLANCTIPMPYMPSNRPLVVCVEPARLSRLHAEGMLPETVMRQVRITVPAGGPDAPDGGMLSAMYI